MWSKEEVREPIQWKGVIKISKNRPFFCQQAFLSKIQYAQNWIYEWNLSKNGWLLYSRQRSVYRRNISFGLQSYWQTLILPMTQWYRESAMKTWKRQEIKFAQNVWQLYFTHIFNFLPRNVSTFNMFFVCRL